MPRKNPMRVYEESGIFTARFAEHRIRTKKWRFDRKLAEATIEFCKYTGLCTMADFGAGIGKYVDYFRNPGELVCVGYDGIQGIHEISRGLVIQKDLGVSHRWKRQVDLVFCIETGEHIPRDHIQSFIENIGDATSSCAIVSWGLPGQKGSGHVSCMELDELSRKFRCFADMQYSGLMTYILRNLIVGKCGYRERLYVFEKPYLGR